MGVESKRRSKAIVAALALVSEGGWKAVTFPAIADVSGVGLADLRREFTCKTDILRAFQAEVDAEVLAKSKPATPEQSPRDRVFVMIMNSFEAITPYKAELRSC